jgi:hypothetical protein
VVLNIVGMIKSKLTNITTVRIFFVLKYLSLLLGN